MKPTLENCPACGAALEGNPASCAKCRWTMRNWRRELASAPAGPEHGRCAYDADGQRCRYPGMLASATTTSGQLYCRWHFRCADAAMGAAIVEDSQQYAPPSRDDAERAFDGEAQRHLEQLGLQRQTNESRAAWIERLRVFCRQGITRLAKGKPGENDSISDA